MEFAALCLPSSPNLSDPTSKDPPSYALTHCLYVAFSLQTFILLQHGIQFNWSLPESCTVTVLILSQIFLLNLKLTTAAFFTVYTRIVGHLKSDWCYMPTPFKNVSAKVRYLTTGSKFRQCSGQIYIADYDVLSNRDFSTHLRRRWIDPLPTGT